MKIGSRVDLERVRVENYTVEDFWASMSKCGEKHLSRPIYRFSNGPRTSDDVIRIWDL